nr:MAG TPA: hypothetical protein [Caudoviricetes sp.]
MQPLFDCGKTPAHGSAARWRSAHAAEIPEN